MARTFEVVIGNDETVIIDPGGGPLLTSTILLTSLTLETQG
jgi:hypothetical protein